jgi:dipeptide transport system substrate-binding protein
MKMKKIVSALALCAASASVFANGGTLVFCSEASPAGFDASQFTARTDFDAIAFPMFDTLISYKPGTTEMIPALAEKWDVSPDGKTYTFHLRPNVKFHTTDYFKPTRAMQAEDVVFTFGRLIKRDHPANKLYPAEFPYAIDTGMASNIASIKKLDNLTVEFKLKEVDAPFLSKIAMKFAVVQSVEYAQQLANAGKLDHLNQKPIGTGPFIFSSYAKDEAIRYNANREYWNPEAVKLDKLIFAITKDAAARVQKLNKGECDLTVVDRAADIADIKKNPALKVASAPNFDVSYVAYNVEKPELKKLEVRQALDMAIDRKALIEAVYQNQGKVATNPFPAVLWSYNATLKNPTVDVAKAKALLAKAGYPNGFEFDFWAFTSNPIRKMTAEMLQADWAKIGVKANIVTFEWGEFLKRLKTGEHDASLMSWGGDYADPDAFLRILLSCEAVGGSNYSRYCSKEFEALVQKASKTVDVAERTKLYEQAQVLFKHDLPWSTLSHSVDNQPMRKEVMGYTINAFGGHDFRYVSKAQ